MGPRTGVETVVKKKNIGATAKKRILVIQSVASHDSDLAFESLLPLSTQKITSDLDSGDAGGKSDVKIVVTNKQCIPVQTHRPYVQVRLVCES